MSDERATAGTAQPATATSGVDPAALVCDLACLGFAGWTLLCNAVVWCGGNAAALASSALTAALALALGAGWLLRRHPRALAWLGEVSAPAHSIGVEPSSRMRVAFITLALAIVVLFRQRGDLRQLCGLALGYFVLAYASLLRAAPVASQTAARGPALRRESWALFALGLAHAGLALCAHVPDPDDTMYVNMAVAVADFPQRALLSFDSLHGIATAGFKGVYRLQSLELGVGLINYLSGLPALPVFHTLVPAVAAFCTPLALARVLRELDPRRAFWAVLLVLLLLVLDGGGGPGSYQRFGFIRLFQGKAVFATVLIPALMAYGIRFGLRPSPSRFALLAAAQIAALGTTVTALWAAPAVAMLGVLTPQRPNLRALRTLLAGLLSCAYLVCWGGFLALQLRAGVAGSTVALSGADVDAVSAPPAPTALDLMAHAYSMVLGHGMHQASALAIALLAWPLCRTTLSRRFAVVFPLGSFALLGNPWLAVFVSGLTTVSIYWRVVWLLPVPLLTALALTSPLRPGLGLSRRTGAAVCLIASALLVGWLAQRHPTLEHADLGLPRPKVDARAYRVARALVRWVPPKRNVLAPARVSMLLPMLNGYSYPLATKPRYIPVSVEDRRIRVQLGRVLEQAGAALDTVWFAQKLDDYRVEGVALPQGRQRRKLGAILTDTGFAVTASVAGHEIWTRRLAGAAPPSPAAPVTGSPAEDEATPAAESPASETTD